VSILLSRRSSWQAKLELLKQLLGDKLVVLDLSLLAPVKISEAVERLLDYVTDKLLSVYQAVSW